MIDITRKIDKETMMEQKKILTEIDIKVIMQKNIGIVTDIEI